MTNEIPNDTLLSTTGDIESSYLVIEEDRGSDEWADGVTAAYVVDRFESNGTWRDTYGGVGSGLTLPWAERLDVSVLGRYDADRFDEIPGAIRRRLVASGFLTEFNEARLLVEQANAAANAATLRAQASDRNVRYHQWLQSDEGSRAWAAVRLLPRVTQLLTEAWGLPADSMFEWRMMPPDAQDPRPTTLSYEAQPLGFTNSYYMQVYLNSPRELGFLDESLYTLDSIDACESGVDDLRSPVRLAEWLAESYAEMNATWLYDNPED